MAIIKKMKTSAGEEVEKEEFLQSYYEYKLV
jgi:hypothetical protein